MRAISNALPRISVVIPTYRREEVLIASIRDLLALDEAPAEILVIDQTEEHDAATTACLREFEERGSIRWFQLAEPSIPTAMNKGLIEARHDIVLFLDDDIRPDADLVLGPCHCAPE